MSNLADNVLVQMRRVYDWQRANQTRYVIRRTGKKRFLKNTDWERGVFWSAVSHAWLETQDPAYLEGTLNYTLQTGFRPGPLQRFADDQVCIQAYLDVWPTFGDQEILEYQQASFDVMVNEPKPGRVDWYWCDSLFMAPPSFFSFAKVANKPEYREYAHQAFWDSIEHLWDPETNLVYRDARYIPNAEGTELREANGEKVFWSRGLGWVLAAVPRLLRHVPKDWEHTQKYVDLFVKLAKAVAPYQHADGFWRASLLDPQTFPAPESSATGLFAYGLAWGVNNGYLDAKEFGPVVEKAWAALESAVHPSGMLGWVQLPAFNPREVKFEHNIDYGAAAFLLAGIEVHKYFKARNK